MIIKIRHRLSKEEAKGRIQKLANNVKTEFKNEFKNLNEEWKGDAASFNFTSLGHFISGTIELKDSLFEMELNLPFIAFLFKGKIRADIEERIIKTLY